jgi:predicted transposase
VKRTIQLKLLPTPEQAESLTRTLQTANAACDYISQVAWDARTFGQFPIHRLTYGAVRETFGIAAQLTVRCIAKVADAYKLDKQFRRTFAPLGAVAFDERILAYKSTSVSIWTMDGRQTIPFVRTINEKERVSILLVEQNAAMALDLADHAYLIETGRIVLSGTADALKKDDSVRKAYLGY